MVLCLKARESRSLPGLPDYIYNLVRYENGASRGAFFAGNIFISLGAGWSSPVARQAHNLKVAGSNPAPATNLLARP